MANKSETKVTILWEFHVKGDRVAEFERIDASNGKWAELFKRGRGFIGSRLFKSPEVPNLFLTIDQWESMKDYKAFLRQWNEEYEALDKQCEGLTEHEICLGTFDPDIRDED